MDNYANPRHIALKTLYEIEKNDIYANIALKKALANSMIKPIDKAFVTNLVYGVIKNRLRLDHIISQFSSIKLKKLSDFVLLILRMGVYQIIFMDKVPTSAAVDECVKLAAKYAPKSKGFINAVLRNIHRGKDGITYPNDKVQYLSVYYSYPPELVSMWLSGMSYVECKALLEAMNTPSGTTIRVNTQRIAADGLIKRLASQGISAKPAKLEDALTIEGTDIANLDEYLQGLFTPQGESSMLAPIVLAPKQDMLVIDLCAAPGGKSTYISQLMQNTGKVIAFDIYAHKLELIRQNAKRMGADNIDAKEQDATMLAHECISKADRVLADVPCSGLGIIGKKPDIKWKVAREDVSSLTKLQYNILSCGAKYLKPGGELVYSTCTINDAENIDQCRRFITENPEFEMIDIRQYLPQSLSDTTAKEGYIQILPHIHGMDGFFICKMRKKL